MAANDRQRIRGRAFSRYRSFLIDGKRTGGRERNNSSANSNDPRPLNRPSLSSGAIEVGRAENGPIADHYPSPGGRWRFMANPAGGFEPGLPTVQSAPKDR